MSERERARRLPSTEGRAAAGGSVFEALRRPLSPPAGDGGEGVTDLQDHLTEVAAAIAWTELWVNLGELLGVRG